MSSESIVRRVTSADLSQISYLVNNAEYIHRHLDWRTALDWVGKEPFFGIERHGRMVAALACPRDDTGIGWVRLFASLDWNSAQLTAGWNQLFERLLDQVETGQGYTLAALGLQSWFSEALQKSGFANKQNIVVLQWMGELRENRPLPGNITIRPMLISDVALVLTVDHRAFGPLWQHSHIELEMAFQQATYASVAEMAGEIVGYQISTGTPYHAHLARLAVSPDLQRLSIGYALVWDMLDHFNQRGTTSISVNTQSDNFSSLSLYDKLGFQRTGDEYPVFTYFIA